MSNYPAKSDRSNSDKAYSNYTGGTIVVRDRGSRDTTEEHEPSWSSSRQSLEILKEENGSVLLKDKNVYSGPQHRKFTHSIDSHDEHIEEKSEQIHKVIWEDFLTEHPELKSEAIYPWLEKLSDSLIELNHLESGLDEKVLLHFLKSLYDVNLT